MPSRDQALRDQFSDNVRDPLLRKELKRMIRSNSDDTFLEIREEALPWMEEEEKPPPLRRNVTNEAFSTREPNKEMHKVFQASEEQQKSTDSLSHALSSMVRSNDNSPDNYGWGGNRNASRRGFDKRGNITCNKCQGIGRIVRECRHTQDQSQNSHTINPNPEALKNNHPLSGARR